MTKHPTGLLLALGGLLLFAATARAELPTYDLLYNVTLVPSERGARVEIQLGAGSGPIEWFRFRIDPTRHLDFTGNGKIVREEGSVEWQPPSSGGRLRYFFVIDHLRDERSYDARCTKNWALFRGDDLVPPARVLGKAESRSRLRLRLPEGWSAALPYARLTGGHYQIEHPHRRFDRPTGWMVFGKLGVVREEVAGLKLVIAGPRGHGLRRLDLLAMLSWTLPELSRIFGALPERLLVVGAGDPMWRGGLSGPDSIYVHADRPLLTEDGTSPLLHEVVHAVIGRIPGDDADWIIEGLAELYALESLVRSGTLSETRVDAVRERLAARGRSFRGRLTAGAGSGEARARAVTVLYELDATLRAESEGARSLDHVVRRLIQKKEPLTTAELRDQSEQIAGRELPEIFGSMGRPR